MTPNPLRPDPADLGRAWRALVEAEFEQVERLREWQQADYYAPVAHHFADDPHRTDDPTLNELRAMSRADATWLDIGAGGGRYALPLALASARVHAVEPSAGMRGVLGDSLASHGIDNVELHSLRWPEGSDSLQADFTLVAHVGYDIREINEFLDGVERATRERCCVILMDRAPSGGFTRLWEQVHGEPRVLLPGMREFLTLLLARGATPDVRVSQRRMRPLDEPEIRESARRRLWLQEGSTKDQHLTRLLDDLLKNGIDDETIPTYGFPTVIALITWMPGDRDA